MEWARIPVGLLIDRIPERDLTAVVKYQLLWAHLERDPTSEEVLRWLTTDQAKRAREYLDSMSKMIEPDIRQLIRKRGRDKKLYYKNKAATEVSTDGTHGGTTGDSSGAPTDHTVEKNENNTTNKKIIEKSGVSEDPGLGRGYHGFKGIPIPPYNSA